MVLRRWDPGIGEVNCAGADSYLMEIIGDMHQRFRPNLKGTDLIHGKGIFGKLRRCSFLMKRISKRAIKKTKEYRGSVAWVFWSYGKWRGYKEKVEDIGSPQDQHKAERQ
ncbi:hypothetical protein HA466_0109390 [Hirschfeldia incana]|nr:hypothetical protein HA466_0109390 [Hirschfeldia incana]